MNGMRVNTVVSELKGEKIDIINWSDNPAELIENALSPAKVITVLADDEEKTATVIVPDSQLSLAIGKEGQNARLAARLTGFKIDILNESQNTDLLEEIYSSRYGSDDDYDYDDYPESDEDGYFDEDDYEEDEQSFDDQEITEDDKE